MKATEEDAKYASNDTITTEQVPQSLLSPSKNGSAYMQNRRGTQLKVIRLVVLLLTLGVHVPK